MPRFLISRLAPSVLATASGFALAAQAPAQTASPIPDFQSKNVSWTAINSDFTPVEGSPSPVTFDRAHPFFRNDQARDNGGQATYRVPDANNPNLKPWVAEELKKQRETLERLLTSVAPPTALGAGRTSTREVQ